MNGDMVQLQVAEVAEALHQRSAQLAIALARAITREVRLYRTAAPVPFEMVVDSCSSTVRPIFSAIAADTQYDTTVASAVGIERARDGVPLASVMEAYRVGFHGVLDAVAQELAARANVNGDVLRALTTKITAAEDVFTSAMAVAYRKEQARRLLDDESAHSDLIDSVLQGRLFGQWSVWDAADYLRLPSEGPYVVVAAEVPVVGAEALPDIESKLRSMDVFSAWRLLPDLHVGIVHVKTDKHLSNVLALLSRIATDSVGVSSRFDDLRETAQALRYARVALRGRPEPGQCVALFDGSILATAAVSAPEVMVKPDSTDRPCGWRLSC
jgi:hypothetical protein